MGHIQKLVRMQSFYAKYVRIFRLGHYCGYQNTGRYLYESATNSNNIISVGSYQDCGLSYVNLFSTSSESQAEELDVNLFEKVCEETLESLTEFFEELIESKEALKNADVTYSGGVLTINLGNNLGTYVINRQSPNKQIWLSSPTSGPKRYDYVLNGQYWVYKHDMVPLHKLLQSEFSVILGEKIDFFKMFTFKTLIGCIAVYAPEAFNTYLQYFGARTLFL
ncbi:hypothetical protein NQ315_012774 [Exocentrus adspersus]|uniref:ferroxidase n=1 Tax=Exocentrus adspersus TaxID=1586481 RepID=A0AAV8VCV2_9CUCU|nr:hypothetical protein NQ315_012774 [Exocentrus adspersus]